MTVRADGGTTTDIWFIGGFQFDSVLQTALVLGSSLSGSLVDVHVNDGYFTAASSQSGASIINAFSSSSTTKNIWVTGNEIYGNTANAFHAIEFSGVRDWSFDNNVIFEWNNSGSDAVKGLIFTNAGSNFTIANNKADRENVASQFTYFVTTTNRGDYYVVRNNLSKRIASAGTTQNTNVSNLAAGPHATVDGNW